jgi:cytochrome c556
LAKFGRLQSKAQSLQAETEKLSATNISDGKVLRDHFRKVAFACDACHDKYRATGQKRQ